jgi:hypothetical protein
MDFLQKIFPIDNNGKINIFGFSLYADDLLIIALLFLLYWEKVSNKFLYIILLSLVL